MAFRTLFAPLPAPLAFLLLLVVAPATSAAEPPRDPRDRPNVLLIMADDVGWEAFSCYGAEDYETPHIDALAARGVRFEYGYSTPICTTTRVQIMTGKYSFRNYTHFGLLPDGERTFGHLLREAGYATAVAGKWQLNGIYNELPGHDDPARVARLGFDQHCLWQLTLTKNHPEGGERFWSPVLEIDGRIPDAGENRDRYGPDIFADYLGDFMEENRDRPFFAYFPMALVHDPFVPTPDTIGDAPRDQEANKQPRGKDAGPKKKANFVAMVEYMDKIVGRLIGRIDELGLTKNTLVIFTSDNGTHPSIVSRWNGRDIRGDKAGLTDAGTRVPLVVSWPGTVVKGVVLDDLVDFTDFYPTLAEATGAKIGEDEILDGRSFFPRLLGRPGNPREWILNYYQPYWNKEPGLWVRDRTYKLYADGRFHRVPGDLEEKNPLPPGTAGEKGEAARRQLQSVLDRCPPVPGGKLDRDTAGRPVYPDWPVLIGDGE